MQALLASVVLAALLVLTGRVQASTRDEGAARTEEASPLSGGALDEPIGRCTEAPISLAFDVESYEASRAVGAEALSSPGTPVVATPAPARAVTAVAAPRVARNAAPFTPVPRACIDMRDPRCSFNAIPPAPERVHLESSAHVALLPTFAVPFVPEPFVSDLPAPESVSPRGGPHDAHARPQWRPPRA